MFDPEENGTVQPDAETSAPDVSEEKIHTPVRGETDRESGEYHYKNGYTQRIYADAHYEPAEESTVPPRYYTPHEKPVKEAKPKKEKKGLGFVPVLCLCLVCALLGGAIAAGAMGSQMNKRISALEESVEAYSAAEAEEAPVVEVPALPAATEGNPPERMAASEIYAQSLEQVVGISTDITYTNLFGQTTSYPVSGSGFIISEDGYILTNYHVIEYAYEGKLDVTVMTYDGTKYDAAIVGVEQANDVAVLKIDAENLNAAKIGNSDAIHVGDTIYAVGNPLGELEFSMSTGHVSAKDRVISTEESESLNMFQVDAAVNPGNSGGPVYNARGEVIGMVTAKYSDTGVEGLGFAIPINDAASIANDLITKGYVTGKAYMGIQINNSGNPYEQYGPMWAQAWGTPLGVLVDGVEEGSAAEKAGIQTKDIITKVGDYEISDYAELKTALRNFSAGETAQVEVFRMALSPGDEVTGETITLTITFDEVKPSVEQ